MKTRTTNWTIIKIVLFIVVAGVTLVQKPDIYQENPPMFIYPIVSLFTFIFSIGFFKGSSNNKLSKGTLKNNPLKFFSDPLPFHHLGAISLIISGGIDMIRCMVIDKPVDPFSWFSLSIGFPLLLSVYIANKKFLKKD